MLAERAAKQKKIHWANVGPNYEWGHTNWDAFKEGLKHYEPDAQFVAEQWPKVNNLNAGEVVQSLLEANPDAIYTSLFGNDLAEFIREGTKRHLFDNRLVVSLSAGMIQIQDLMKNELPEGWLVLAYPFPEINTPEMKKFVTSYEARYHEAPDFPSVYGYVWVYFLKDLITAAGSVDPDLLKQKLPGFSFKSILGPLTIRAIDHQSTMGAWIGTTALRQGKPTVIDWTYVAPEPYFPTDDYIRARRK
jgi:branched-chain amino acid transport system substrate-binding protein